MFKKLLICLLLIQQAAWAGVMTKMVNSSAEDEAAISECRVALEEANQANQKLSLESNELKAKLQKLLTDLKANAKSNEDLQGQIVKLKEENNLLNQKIEELKKECAAQNDQEKASSQESPKPISQVKNNKEETLCPTCAVAHLIGPVVGMPVGTVVGTLRGGISKSAELAKANQNPALKVGAAAFGFVTGTVAGMFNGLLNGLVFGLFEPFSQESFSTTKSYDPYRLL